MCTSIAHTVGFEAGQSLFAVLESNGFIHPRDGNAIELTARQSKGDEIRGANITRYVSQKFRGESEQGCLAHGSGAPVVANGEVYLSHQSHYYSAFDCPG